ncbi:MAG: extracellular solute-binding protein [Spirochaetes bacterium]|nr:extracellular solute-binding protein [Spirochaetota bacterium]
MKKRVFSLLVLSLILISFFVLFSCKPGAKEIKSGKLTIWHQMDPAEEALLQELIKKFNEKYPDIKIEAVHYQTEDLRTNYQTAAVAGEGPDIVYGPADNVGVFATLKGGIIKTLDEYLPKDFVASFLDFALANFKYKGKIWGLPDRIGNHLMLIVNKKLLDKRIDSFDEIINNYASYAKNLEDKDPKNDQWPIVFFAKEPFWFVAFYGAFGGNVFKNDNEPDLNNEAMIKALKFYKSLYDKKIIPKDLDYNAADTLFKEGKSLMIINGDWSLGNYQQTMDIVTFPIPKVPGGNYPKPYTSSKGYSINANINDKQVQLAIQFLKFVLSYENQKLWATKLNILPANKKYFGEMEAGASAVIKGSMEQLSYGTPMPTIPEMRAVWDAIRPNLEAVLNGSKTPEQAAADMQKEASEKIAKMKGQ